MRRWFLLLGGCLFLSTAFVWGSSVAVAATCDGATKRWDGGAGSTAWTDPANWSGNQLPGAADVVCIDVPVTTTITVTGAHTVAALDSRGGLAIAGTLVLGEDGQTSAINAGSLSGRLDGPGDVVVSGGFEWSGGVMAGSGSTTVAPSGSLTMVEGWQRLSGRSLVNRGEVAWGASVFYLDDGGSVSNLGTWGASGDGTMAYWQGSEGVFRNGVGGTVVRSGAESVSTVQVDFVNEGSVVAAGGVLGLAGGDGVGVQTGGFSGSGGVVRLASGEWDWAQGASFTGVTELAGGFYTVAAGAVVPLGGETSLSGRLTGPGDVVVSGELSWNGVLMDGSGRTVVAEGTTLDLVGQGGYLRERVFVNRGVLNLPDEGFISSWDATPALVRNEAGATVRKAGAGVFSVGGQVGFDNDGAVEVTGGELALSGGDGAEGQSGSYGSAGPGAVRFAAGEWDLEPGTAFPGTVRFTGGTYTVAPGVGAVFSGDTAWEQGRLDGPGDVVVSGGFEWSGGVMAGSGSTTVAPSGSLTMPGGGPRLTGGRELDTRGTTEWGGTLYVDSGSTITNSGTWTAVGGASITSWTSSFGLFHNKGTGTVRQPAGTSSVHSRFDNDGTVEVVDGTLRLHHVMNVGESSGSLTGGTWSVDGGVLDLPVPLRVNAATLRLDGPEATVRSGSVELGEQPFRNAPAGRITIAGGKSLHLHGAARNDGRIAVADGSLLVDEVYRQVGGTTSLAPAGAIESDVQLEGGTLTGAGAITRDLVQTGGTLSPLGTLRVAGDLTLGTHATYVADVSPSSTDTLNVTGDATLGGTLAIRPAPAYRPPAGTVHRILDAGTRTGTFEDVDGVAIADGRFYEVAYDAAGVQLEVVGPGFALAAYADATMREAEGLGNPCTVRGTAGDDVLVSTDADDVICGFGGADVIVPGGGRDHYIGGPGHDAVSFASTDRAVEADLRRRLATSGAHGYGIAGIESLVGGRAADVLLGSAGSDVLRGGRGADLLRGRGGADVLVGGRGVDAVDGGPGTDRCPAGRGHDALTGCET